MAEMKKGTRIIYTARLGGMETEDDLRYSAVVEPGTEGVFLGRYGGNPMLWKGWFMTKTTTEPPLFVAVRKGHFREATP